MFYKIQLTYKAKLFEIYLRLFRDFKKYFDRNLNIGISHFIVNLK